MNTKRSTNNPQSGQAIFVIALIMVALIGALGLAVDGGGLALLNRDAQNAADSAALAAAYARCTSGDVSSAALASAAENGFTNAGSTVVDVQSPPASGLGAGDSNFVRVSVRATKPAYFIQLVYPRGLETTVTATAQCSPGTSGGTGYAMFGLGLNGGVSATCHGSCEAAEARRLNIEGNVHTNTGVNFDSGSNTAVITSGTGSLSTANSADPLAEFTFARFNTGGDIWNSVPTDKRFTRSGWTFNATSGNVAQLNGLHVVTGNVTINANNLTSPPFTIVATGTITINNATRGVTAYVEDMLAFSTATNTCNNNVVTVNNGQGDSTGIIYAPYGQVEVLYNGGTWVGSLVGKWVDWWGYDGTPFSTLRALPSTTPPFVGMAS